VGGVLLVCLNSASRSSSERWRDVALPRITADSPA
jgi:hypothetical protein